VKGYSLAKECQDAIALLEKTKATFLFEHSYGAIVALNIARQYSFTKIALYENLSRSMTQFYLLG